MKSGLKARIQSRPRQEYEVLVALIIRETKPRFGHLRIQILDHYRVGRIDFLSTLSRNLTIDEALEYYKDEVLVKFDETSAVIAIEAESFSPEFSALRAQTIVDRSEEFINEIDNGLAHNRLEFVEKELKPAHQKMQDAKPKMVAFASQHGLVEPEEPSKSLVAVVNELNAELTRNEAQSKNLLSLVVSTL